MPSFRQISVRALITGLGMLAMLNASATIYKWVDEQGKINYSDQPQNKDAVAVDIRFSQPAKHSNTDNKDNQTSAPGKPAGQPQQAASQKDEPPKLSRKEKRARCADAKKRLQAITVRNRVRERDAKGNLRYLSEKERQAQLKAAQKNIRKYCR